MRRKKNWDSLLLRTKRDLQNKGCGKKQAERSDRYFKREQEKTEQREENQQEL